MGHTLYLAWRYLCHHRARSLIVLACLSLMAYLPLALHIVLDEGERRMSARADATPLLLGARGSAVDLVLNGLYFSGAGTHALSMAEAERIAATDWADPLPLFLGFHIQGKPLVGVSIDYFEFRNLVPASGRLPALLGECVLGTDAAAALGLKPGDSLATAPDNLFDLAGLFPLKLRVTGVLAKTHGPDDQAVFADLQTLWVVAGLGHGHAEQAPVSSAFGRGGKAAADAKLLNYTEITPDNIDSFHFHGDPASFPIHAVIAVPRDQRASTLLRGRYVDDKAPTQLVQPGKVVRGLIQNIFRVRALFDGVLLLVGGATLLTLGLVFALSLRLREGEIRTIALIGCSRSTVARMVAAEVLLLLTASGVVCFALVELTRRFAGDALRQFFIS